MNEQLFFGSVSSVSLVVLGSLLALNQFANWGLALVGVGLFAVTATSWLASRARPMLDRVPAAVDRTVGTVQ